MHSPVSHAVSHTMESRKKQTSSRKRVSRRRKPTRKPARNAGPPVAMGGQRRQRNPGIRAVGGSDGRIRVVHREKLGNVVSQTTFATALSYHELNPGMDMTFPWLSQVAHAYEFYEFKRLTFVYVPSCPTTTTGSYIMAVDYDAADDEPDTDMALSGYHGSVEGPLWKEIRLTCDVKSLGRFYAQRAMRYGGLSPNKDIKTYDVGTLYFAATSNASTETGRLWVEYEVDLMNPQIPTLFDDADNSATLATITNSRDHPFTPAAGTVQDKLGSGAFHTVNSAGGDNFIFDKAGEYLAFLDFTGTTFAEVAPTLAAVGAATVAWVASNTPMRNAAATLAMSILRIKVPKSGDGFKLDCTPICATLAATVVRVMPYLFDNA